MSIMYCNCPETAPQTLRLKMKLLKIVNMTPSFSLKTLCVAGHPLGYGTRYPLGSRLLILVDRVFWEMDFNHQSLYSSLPVMYNWQLATG